MSRGLFTHASPMLFYSGTKHPQLSSCFLVQMSDDSIEGIYDTLKRCALISKVRWIYCFGEGRGGVGRGLKVLFFLFLFSLFRLFFEGE